MTETMQAAYCREYGSPHVVTLEAIPIPSPTGDMVLVDVAYAAVNFPDVLIVQNAYQVTAELPFVPGSEFAGVVSSVGDDVAADPDGLRPGDHVYGITFVGAFAEHVCVPTHELTKLAPSIPWPTAAAFSVAHITAYHALRSFAEVRAGDWVLVLGAAGGVGLAAVEIAAQMGARVIAGASSHEKLAVCSTKGAEVLVDYLADDLRGAVRSATGEGADVVIDPVGGSFTGAAVRSMRWGGRFVTVGFAAGDIPQLALNLVLLKGLTVRGFDFVNFAKHRPDEAARNRAEVLGLLETGRIEPHVCDIFPLSQSGAALQLVADRKAIGKVLIELNATL
jgi:NADPH2:quinone reductase